MNLDELKSQWEDHDAKLDRVLRLNVRLLQAPGLNKVETAMRRLTGWLAIEVGLNLVAFSQRTSTSHGFCCQRWCCT